MKFGNLLTYQNAKTIKGEKLGYLTGILYMTPAFADDGANLCPFSTPGCRDVCLNTAGRGIFNSVQAGRARKRALYLKSPNLFIVYLARDLERLRRKSHNLGLLPCVRLNGTTDIPWEKVAPELFSAFPDVKFYDYTKNHNRMRIKLPGSYDLTYSHAEKRERFSLEVLKTGGRVSVVFDTKKGMPLPRTWHGYKVHDGDLHDLTFLNRTGVIGLRAKGRAKHDTSGFVVRGLAS